MKKVYKKVKTEDKNGQSYSQTHNSNAARVNSWNFKTIAMHIHQFIEQQTKITLLAYSLMVFDTI